MKKALVVEDDPSILTLMSELLREQGFQTVYPANNPDAALALAAAQGFDLVVLDYHLGQQSGIEVAEQLRALPGFEAPVLVTTALPSARAHQVCAELDACECVTKPFDVTDFLEAVQACLDRHEPRLAAWARS